MNPAQTEIAVSDIKTWKPLFLQNLYRVILSSIFLILFSLKSSPSTLGQHDPMLFMLTAQSYFSISIIAILAIQRRWASFNTLIHGLTFLDIAALTLLMHASGSIESGLGMLLVVSIAGSSMITAGRTGNLFAAMAAIAVISEQIYAQIESVLKTNYTQAGFLGVTLFATAILSHVMSTRLRETEALATQRGIDLANMAQLNEHVIKRLQYGLIVVDSRGQIRLMNESAWHMLGLPIVEKMHHPPLASISADLHNQVIAWRAGQITRPKVIRSDNVTPNILPHLTSLGSSDDSGTMIFLEDSTRTHQQAQQMKLASLGRLVASIAHEIRNPLGAISHAEQLLAESPQLPEEDKRLTEIIHDNSARVNAIIENVLQLSRRGNTLAESIVLDEWLNKFCSEFVLDHNIDRSDISIKVSPIDTTIFIDSTQLQQILWNLCQNGLRYSKDYTSSPKLEIHGGMTADRRHPFLEIIDHGSGVDPVNAEKIFEPFFTTEVSGSGLGLYISRELCEANFASLRYKALPTSGSCFRIEFTSPPED
ncbi:MAG: PAS domain-containing sensor histidine kinase [Thiohalomonadales bacterium]